MLSNVDENGTEKRGATLGQVREGTKTIASDRVEGWVGDGILGRELICDIYFKVSLPKPALPPHLKLQANYKWTPLRFSLCFVSTLC
jgi:hypothetical protein